MAPIALLVLVLGAAPARVEPGSQAALAAAFSVPETQVLEARRFASAEPLHFPSFVVGRYREVPSAQWSHPGIGRYHACPAGTCVSPLRLGPAAKRITTCALVDLDAPRSEVSLSSVPAAPAAPATATWPAVVLLIEREAGDRERTDLVIISLRKDQPEVVLSHPAEQRAPDATRKEMQGPSPRPSTAPLGHWRESLRFEHRDGLWSLFVTERAVASRWSPCPAPKAYEVGFRLGTTRQFEQVSRPPKPGTCP